MDDRPMTPEELELARERVRAWPLEERQSIARMSQQEARAILLLTSLLDIRPVEDE
jgi:hypothetical protein